LLASIKSIDSALEDVYKYTTMGDRLLVEKAIERAEASIKAAKVHAKLLEKTCFVKPESKKDFEEYINIVSKGLEEIKSDPTKAEKYRIYSRIMLFDSVEKMLAND
jgi:hemerythrin-like domain-containing protein